MGFEDESPTIEEINDQLAEQRKQEELRKTETIAKMEQNRIEDEQAKAKLKALSNTLGIDQMREDIDAVKININYLGERMSDMVKAINNISAAIQGQPVAQEAGAATAPTSKLNLIEGLLQSPLGEKILNKVFKDDAPPPQQIGFLTPDYIMEQTANAVKRKFELGDIIVDAVESTLTKGLTKQIVKHTLNQSVTDTDEPA